MEEKINLSLFQDFFQSSSPAEYAKELINTKNADENKKNVEEIKNKISDLEDRIKKMNDQEKKYKNAKETLLIKLLITIKMLKIFFIMHQKLIKQNQNQSLKESIAERVKKMKKIICLKHLNKKILMIF